MQKNISSQPVLSHLNAYNAVQPFKAVHKMSSFLFITCKQCVGQSNKKTVWNWSWLVSLRFCYGQPQNNYKIQLYRPFMIEYPMQLLLSWELSLWGWGHWTANWCVPTSILASDWDDGSFSHKYLYLITMVTACLLGLTKLKVTVNISHLSHSFLP